MDLLSQRHPVMLFIATMALAFLLATLYMGLAADWLASISWGAGFPHTRAAFASIPSLNCLRLCSLLMADGISYDAGEA